VIKFAGIFFLPKHLLAEPVPDDQVPEIPARQNRIWKWLKKLANKFVP